MENNYIPSAEEQESFVNSLSKEDNRQLAQGNMDGLSKEGFAAYTHTFRLAPPQPNLHQQQWQGNEEGVTPATPMETVVPLAKLGLEKTAEAGANIYNKGGMAGKAAGSALGIGALTAESLIPNNEAEALAQFMGGKALGAVGQGVKALGSAESLAPMAKALAAIPERSTLEVLRNPGLLSRASTVEEANAAYAAKIPGLKNVTDSLRERFGTNIPELGDYKKVIDNVYQKATNGEAGPQDILDGIQAVNEYLGRKDLIKPPRVAQNLGNMKHDWIDLLDQAYPKFKEANRALREAHVAEDFSTWLPQNKNMSPNVLRSMLLARGLATGAGAAVAGMPGAALEAGVGAASMSPKVWGKAIQGLQALGSDVALPNIGEAVSKSTMEMGENAGKSLQKVMSDTRGSLFPAPLNNPEGEFKIVKLSNEGLSDPSDGFRMSKNDYHVYRPGDVEGRPSEIFTSRKEAEAYVKHNKAPDIAQGIRSKGPLTQGELSLLAQRARNLGETELESEHKKALLKALENASEHLNQAKKAAPKRSYQ